MRAARWIAVGAGAAAALGLGACGDDEPEYRNDPRPASPITITAAIDSDRIRVSPEDFGAGPITIIISNQSGAPQRVTFETDEVAGNSAGIRKSAGPVPDDSTAELQADPKKGTYRLAAGDDTIVPAAITVGDPRPSGQDQLLQP